MAERGSTGSRSIRRSRTPGSPRREVRSADVRRQRREDSGSFPESISRRVRGPLTREGRRNISIARPTSICPSHYVHSSETKRPIDRAADSGRPTIATDPLRSYGRENSPSQRGHGTCVPFGRLSLPLTPTWCHSHASRPRLGYGDSRIPPELRRRRRKRAARVEENHVLLELEDV